MSSWSSYPQQQLLQENWRGFLNEQVIIDRHVKILLESLQEVEDDLEQGRDPKIEDIDIVDFMGRMEFGCKFAKDNPNYKGEVIREKLNEFITCYSNIALLSEVENTTPLVIKEGLICGLGVVCSEAVAPELDASLPWIDVIPEGKINNLDYVLEVIENNKKVSKQHRKEIREYGINQFGLENILAYEYIPKLESLL